MLPCLEKWRVICNNYSIPFTGKIIQISQPEFQWVTGQCPPSWCFEEDRFFEILEVNIVDGNLWRIVIGNHRKGDGPVTKGVTEAFLCRVTY